MSLIILHSYSQIATTTSFPDDDLSIDEALIEGLPFWWGRINKNSPKKDMKQFFLSESESLYPSEHIDTPKIEDQDSL